jgi:hypothetical protein
VNFAGFDSIVRFSKKSPSMCARILRDLQAAGEENVKFMFRTSLLHNLVEHEYAAWERICLVQHRMISVGN